MEIVRLVEQKVLSTVETIVKILEEEVEYPTFEKQLKNELDTLGRDLLKEVFEVLEEKLYHSAERKNHWKVVKRKEKKTILTPFGQLEYGRTYYRHKETKEYTYLLDKKVGITPHMQVSNTVKAELAEKVTQTSYEKATEQLSCYKAGQKVSKQTAGACVKVFQTKPMEKPSGKRRVEALYIEADEDHLSVRGKKGVQARLIYIHEGVENSPRRRLKKVHHFTTVTKSIIDFWSEVCDYIDAHYDLENIKEMYISGDGGHWIRAGQEYIPGAIFILDKFHLARSILRATAHAPNLKRKIYKDIRQLNKQGVLRHLEEALALAQEIPRQKRILQTICYIENNWAGIESAVKHPHISCSAEGHISHVLASRMSSRPMAWSIQGAENMAAMRAVQANNESVGEHYLAACKGKTDLVIELKEEVKKAIKFLKQRKIGQENIGNVPIFQAGSSFTTTALRGLNGKIVV